ncbi:MAG: hypothetical protein C4520_03085 [Candidatus Abyssobacteria bacterium SURF_5]|uniref:Uncharacterized protein n=1 Tax=Abyssobacteria bacterium (strain SURF_5) TaxID=2093360 RepID=A0A3A4P3F8_ABYX5|nr:MAG: hypothetical protein C4520_03085 [Candidatus Abyssubacteria bacterium SURF_5]
MQELAEFRVPEDNAQRYLRPNEGKLLGDSVRKVIVPLRGERAQYIGRIDKAMHREEDRSFFFGWHIVRKYTKEELRNAELLQIIIKRTFEPAAEECGTVYDDYNACRLCGFDRKQMTELFLSVGRLGTRTDIARTIAGEVVVSAHFAETWERHELTGLGFRQVYRRMSRRSQLAGKQPTAAEGWYQIVPLSKPVEVVPPTRAGIHPFDDDEEGEYRCPGHVLGLNLLSELTVSRESYEGRDFAVTNLGFGCKRGLLRPERRLVISQRAWNCLLRDKVRGFTVEIVHLV